LNLNVLKHFMTQTHSKGYFEDLCWVLVHMHHKHNLSVNKIERLTGLKPRSIWRVLKLYKETGQVMPPAAKSGHLRKLDDNDINVRDQICHFLLSGYAQGVSFLQYLKSCITHSADSYLDKLQTQLEEMCHMKVSMSTIWGALKQQGFTMKWVCQYHVYTGPSSRPQI
jgi:hypothetical protein